MDNVQALQEQVNLQLLSDLMNYIIGTSNNLNARKTMQQWIKTSIYPLSLTENKDNFINSHNLLYLGEFLAYYEEKGYTSIEDFRAIALALAHTKEFHDDSMYNEIQIENFLKSIAKKLDNNFDVYLAVALYQLTANLKAKDILLYAIADAKYNRAVDCIFTLMLYSREYTFTIM